jgi:steroid delta-isomerase-like uncharacterized protein
MKLFATCPSCTTDIWGWQRACPACLATSSTDPATWSRTARLHQQELLSRIEHERTVNGHRPRPRRVQASWRLVAALATVLLVGLATTPTSLAVQKIVAPVSPAASLSEEAANLEIARRFFEELHDTGDLTVAEDIVAPDAVFHIPGADLTGPEGIGGLVTLLRTAFPDAVFPMEDVVVEGDTVAVRWTMRGTSQGEFQGIPPTGKPIELRGTAFLTIVDGQIIEDWVTYDQLGLLQQLGAAPGAAGATPQA